MTLRLDFTLDLPGFRLCLSEDIAASGVTAVFGRSGAGKSTLLRVIAGLETGAKGRIRWSDTIWQDDRRFLPPHKRGVGYVFQHTQLFPHLSVAGNLDYADRRARGLAGPARAEVIGALDLAPLLMRRPATLSGGERSRVAIGRALLSRPRILLMDEPLSALDEVRKAAILPSLERLRDHIGTPILYVSHSMAEVGRLADRLMLIDAGRVTHHDRLTTLLSDPGAAPALGLREAGAVLLAQVAAQESDGLTRVQTTGGSILLPRVEAPLGTSLRLRILAQDVILARHAPTGLSALNILPVTVTALHSGHGPGTMVQLRLGSDLILARITQRSAAALALETGTDCFAILKTVSVAPGNIGRGTVTGTIP